MPLSKLSTVTDELREMFPNIFCIRCYLFADMNGKEYKPSKQRNMHITQWSTGELIYSCPLCGYKQNNDATNRYNKLIQALNGSV